MEGHRKEKKNEELKKNLEKMYQLFQSYLRYIVAEQITTISANPKTKMEVWYPNLGCTAKSNIKVLQTFQNNDLRLITNSSWYIRNDDIHSDLDMLKVNEVIKI